MHRKLFQRFHQQVQSSDRKQKNPDQDSTRVAMACHNGPKIPSLFDNHVLECHFRDQARLRDQMIVFGVVECAVDCELVVIVGCFDFFENWRKYLAGRVIFQGQL